MDLDRGADDTMQEAIQIRQLESVLRTFIGGKKSIQAIEIAHWRLLSVGDQNTIGLLHKIRRKGLSR